MRVLKFNVNGQILEKSKDCDFDHIVAGSKNYLKMYFSFSDELKSFRKIARFSDGEKEDYMPIIEGFCNVPEEMLKKKYFRVGVILMNDDKYIPTTQQCIVQEVIS